MINYALILAGGRGGRLMPLTFETPKAMVLYKNKPLIFEVIKSLQDYVNDIYVTVGYKKELLGSYLLGLNVRGLINTEGKENIWWLFNSSLKYLTEPIIVSTCDIIFELDIDSVIREYFAAGEPPCMLLAAKPLPNFDGDYIQQHDGVVHQISRIEKSPIVCSGLQILYPSKINALVSDAENFYDLWSLLIKNNLLYCSTIILEKWYTINTVEHLESANKLFNK